MGAVIWVSVGGIGGAVHNCVIQWRCHDAQHHRTAALWEKVRIRDRWDGRISLGDGRPSTRCGNVAVVALFLLIKRKMLFHRVRCAGSFKGLKPEIVW